MFHRLAGWFHSLFHHTTPKPATPPTVSGDSFREAPHGEIGCDVATSEHGYEIGSKSGYVKG